MAKDGDYTMAFLHGLEGKDCSTLGENIFFYGSLLFILLVELYVVFLAYIDNSYCNKGKDYIAFGENWCVGIGDDKE